MWNSNCISFCELCVLASRGVIMSPGLSMRVVMPIVRNIPDLTCKGRKCHRNEKCYELSVHALITDSSGLVHELSICLSIHLLFVCLFVSQFVCLSAVSVCLFGNTIPSCQDGLIV